jgi:CspA family cold shock protein
MSKSKVVSVKRITHRIGSYSNQSIIRVSFRSGALRWLVQSGVNGQTFLVLRLNKSGGTVMEKATGVVKWFSRLKGYGFINPDNGGQEIFVHYSAISGEGYRNLYEGDRVEFEMIDQGKGPQAKNVNARRM